MAAISLLMLTEQGHLISPRNEEHVIALKELDKPNETKRSADLLHA